MMMTGFEAYKLYIALKSHFTTSYDFFKYQGKVNVKFSSFDKRSDKWFFEKIAKKYNTDLQNFLVSIMRDNPKIWIGDLVTDSRADEKYIEWKKITESLTNTYSTDIDKLPRSLADLCSFKPTSKPLLLSKLINGEICLETFVILNTLLKIIPKWNKQNLVDPLWDNIKIVVEKYTPFLEMDKDKLRKLSIDYFKE